MRIRSLGLAATVLLALASAPPAVAQTLPSDVEERLGLPRNRQYPPHIRRELMREYEYLRRQETAEDRGRRRYDDDRRRYRRDDRYDDDRERRRYRGPYPAYGYPGPY
jgi:hypothetical protein